MFVSKTSKSPLKGAVCLAALLLFATFPPANVQVEFTGGLIDRPKRLTADLSRWPFGDKERIYTNQPARSGSMRLLRRAVADGFPIVPKWRARLRQAQGSTKFQRLALVNILVNSVPYARDRLNEWRHPRVFLTEGGDCDCSSVAKYVLLRKVGFAAQDIRITGLRIRGRKRVHAVVVVRTGPGQFQRYVLDNRSDNVRTALYTDEFAPFVSLNEEGIWLHGNVAAKYLAPFVNPVIRE